MADLEILYDPITVGVTGLDNIKADTTFTVPKPIDTSLTLSVPDTVKTDTKLTLSTPDTLKTDAKLTLSIPDPIKTDSKAAIDTRSAIDLQPVVVDQCFRLSLGALPPTLICLPNRQRLGLTLFGVEVFGLTLDGEAKVVVQDLPRPPHVINVPAPPAAQHHAGAVHDHPEPPHAGAGHAERAPPFVVRLGG